MSNISLQSFQNSKNLMILKRINKRWNACFPGRKHFLKYVINGAAKKVAFSFVGALTTYHLHNNGGSTSHRERILTITELSDLSINLGRSGSVRQKNSCLPSKNKKTVVNMTIFMNPGLIQKDTIPIWTL